MVFKNWLKQNYLYLLALITVILITYANSLNNGFLSDDIAEIVQNPNLSRPDVFLTAHPLGFLRPLFYFFALSIGGLSPIFFRLINVFFHAGSVIMIFILLNLMLSKRIAFFVSLIAAVHPALSEAVIWISGGSYEQYSFFFLLSLIFYILSPKKRLYLWISTASLFLSFMSHPVMPVSFVPIIFLYEISFGNIKKNWLKLIPFVAVTVIYLGVNLAGLGERINTLQNTHYQERGTDNIFMTVPISISSYFQLFFWPEILTIYHSELAFSPVELFTRFLLTIIFFSGIIFSFWKGKKNIFFWLSFFIITLGPTLTPFRLNWIVAERYIYLPSLGIFTVFVYLITYLAKKIKIKSLDITVIVIIVLALIPRTIIRNTDWKDDIHFWIETGKTSPSSPNNHNNLGDAYGRLGDKQRSIQEFQTAIALKPNYADAYHNLANAYREVNQFDKAIENYQKALEFNPNLWQSYQNIASIYFALKKYDLAEENIQKAIMVFPNNINLRLNLGIVLLTSGKKEKAKAVFTEILSVDPQNQIARQGLAESSK